MSFKNFSTEKPHFSWPTFGQWRQLPKVLTKNEKRALFLLFILFLFSSFFLGSKFYYKNTEVRPAPGGSYIEGMVGQPRFINPVYSPLNDVDRDLAEILFSGLMKYDKEGKIINDLADRFEVKEDGKTYEFFLKDNIFWSDGKKFSADDIIFTVETIQSPDYKSPLRAESLGIEIERVSDYQVRFKLKKPSAVFLESTTLKIMPKHIWQEVSPENFPLNTYYNLEPVGIGPYKFESLEKDKSGFTESLTLVKDPKYFSQKPFISRIEFKFFKTEEELLKAAKKGEIDGFSLTNTEVHQDFLKKGFSSYKLTLPRYFAVFFNPEKSEILSDPEIRKALTLATNKEEILREVLLGYGKIINSPLMPEIYGFSSPSVINEFDLDKAKELLNEVGFKDIDGDGFREKNIEKNAAFQFTSTLNVGSQGVEVQELQKCLAQDPEVYPEGEISGYFGNLTKKAVINFQEYKKKKEKEREIITTKTKALDDLQDNIEDSYNYNYHFYKLVDLFMQEHYPDYAWKFDVWLEQILKQK